MQTGALLESEPKRSKSLNTVYMRLLSYTWLFSFYCKITCIRSSTLALVIVTGHSVAACFHLTLEGKREWAGYTLA